MSFTTNQVYKFNYANSNPSKDRLVLVNRVGADRILGIELDSGETKQFIKAYIKNVQTVPHRILPIEASPWAGGIFGNMFNTDGAKVTYYQVGDQLIGVDIPKPKCLLGRVSTEGQSHVVSIDGVSLWIQYGSIYLQKPRWVKSGPQPITKDQLIKHLQASL